MKKTSSIRKLAFGSLLFLNVLSLGIFVVRGKHRWILWFQDLRSSVRSARSHGVPESVLFAMSYVDTRFRLHRDYGRIAWIRMLPWRPERAVTSAFLAESDVDVSTILRNPEMSLRATAQNLAAKFDFSLNDPAILENWRAPLERWQNLDFSVNDKLYADHVLQLVNTGFAGVEDHGVPIEIKGWSQKLAAYRPTSGDRPKEFLGIPALPYLAGSPLASPTFPPERRQVTHIVVHTTENDFFSSLDYLMRPTTGVGAHYMVRAHDGFAVQLADERRPVFHDACFNDNSIGIEHEAYSGNGSLWFSDRMYRASAKIAREIAERYHIPLDREHILGHSETPDCSDHEDPGPQWDWDKYMSYVREG